MISSYTTPAPLNCELLGTETVSDSSLSLTSALSTGSGPMYQSVTATNARRNKPPKMQCFQITDIYSPARETAGQLQLGSLVSVQAEGHLGEGQAARLGSGLVHACLLWDSLEVQRFLDPFSRQSAEGFCCHSHQPAIGQIKSHRQIQCHMKECARLTAKGHGVKKN